jgi:hypothetical protein
MTEREEDQMTDSTITEHSASLIKFLSDQRQTLRRCVREREAHGFRVVTADYAEGRPWAVFDHHTGEVLANGHGQLVDGEHTDWELAWMNNDNWLIVGMIEFDVDRAVPRPKLRVIGTPAEVCDRVSDGMLDCLVVSEPNN